MFTVPVPRCMRRHVRGISVSGCIVDRDRHRVTWSDEIAHAHNKSPDPMQGWICFLDPADVFKADGSPSATLWHEYAHILTPDVDHGLPWRRTMRRLGRSVEKPYRRALR